MERLHNTALDSVVRVYISVMNLFLVGVVKLVMIIKHSISLCLRLGMHRISGYQKGRISGQICRQVETVSIPAGTGTKLSYLYMKTLMCSCLQLFITEKKIGL